jgi:hypothetical protein
MEKASGSQCWRIRMKFGSEPLEKQAWERDKIGIWYGAWQASDLKKALDSHDPAGYLTGLPAQQNVGWPDPSIGAYYKTISRFVNIQECDWVWTCFDHRIHFGHASPEIADDPDFARKQETFKYRTIRDKKSFDLAYLPDSFLLLPSAGRSNVYQLNPEGQGKLINMLASAADQNEVTRKLSGLDLTALLDFLGPATWESVCEAYLIRTEDFLPAGLSVGRTLQNFDIVGRDKMGRRILAQCKKDVHWHAVEQEFIQAGDAFPDARLFYFAYGGSSTDKLPPNTEVLTREHIVRWLAKNPDYAQWLRGRS